MFLQYIKLKNFKSYPDTEIGFDLSFKGIELIVGENGSGKTTVFDAIIWCLYGRSSVNAAEIINRKNKKNCKVEVGFIINNQNYSVLRYREHDTHGNKLYLFKGKKDISMRTITDTENQIINLIGINYTAFTSSIVFTSELYTSFLRSRVSDRLKTFESILSLKEINIYDKITRKFKDEISDNIKDIELEENSSEVNISTMKSSIEDYKENIKQTLLSLKERKQKIEEELEENKKDVEEFADIDVETELNKIITFVEEKKSNKKILEQIEEEQDKLSNIEELVTEYNMLRSKIEEMKAINVSKEIALIDTFEKTAKENSRINLKISELRNEIINTKYLKETLNKLEEEKKYLIIEVEKIKENKDTCPTCNRPLEEGSSVIKDLLEDYKEKLSQNKIKFETTKKELEKADEKNETLTSEIKQLENEIVTEIDQPKYEREFLQKLSDKKNRIEKDLSLLEQEIETKTEKNKEITKRIENLNKQLISLEEPKYQQEFIENLKTQIENKKEEINSLEQELNNIQIQAKNLYDKKYIEKLNNKIEEEKKKLKSIKTKLNKKRKELYHWNILREIFSNKDTGFKKFLISRMINIFNENVNFYLPFFFDREVLIKFEKDLTETITIDGDEVSFGTFSSGQKTRLELAIAFSLSLLSRTFFSSPINLLVFDEILDMNLDSAGTEAVLDVLNNIAKDHSVIVVSHKQELQERFEKIIEVKLIDEETRVISNE